VGFKQLDQHMQQMGIGSTAWHTSAVFKRVPCCVPLKSTVYMYIHGKI